MVIVFSSVPCFAARMATGACRMWAGVVAGGTAMRTGSTVTGTRSIVSCSSRSDFNRQLFDFEFCCLGPLIFCFLLLAIKLISILNINMPKESFDPNQLFTVPAVDFTANYRVLTPDELVELGESPTVIPSVPEEIIAKQEAFLKGTFEAWDKDSAPKAKISTESHSPFEQNWQELEKDVDTDKFGELILNPETQGLDFETSRVFIPDLSSMEGKKLSEVAEFLVSTYGDKYYIPGIEYEEWIFNKKDSDSLPKGKEFATLKQGLKDGYCFFFGSMLRYSDGHWCVPCVYWNGDGWNRRARRLGGGWDSSCRVVLLEK